MVWPLPLFHSLSHIVCVLGVTAVGATAPNPRRGFSAGEVLQALTEENATFLGGVPTMYHYLIAAARDDGFQAPDLRMCLVGGAITTAPLRKSFEEKFGTPLLDAYGSTETCGSITINWPTGARVEGSCGLPVPGLAVRIVDVASGQDVPAEAEGEVWVRGPSVMVGYHNQPGATAEVLQDGWYRTGDLARRDLDGYFTITGRIKELIIRGGENIHPGEIEQVLRSVAGVADVAVAGRPHEILGEVPVAYLVPAPEGFDPAELLAACRERLSYFKVPEELYEVDQVPRTASGKIKRRDLLRKPARLCAAGGQYYESLFRLDWSSVGLSSVPGATGARNRRWAVVGSATLLARLGELAPRCCPRDLAREAVEVSAHENLDALSDVIAAGRSWPDVVVVACTGIDRLDGLADAAVDAARAVEGVGADVALLISQPQFAAATVILITEHAVAVSLKDETPDPVQACIWGYIYGL